MGEQLDLAKLFQVVSDTLAGQRDQINAADDLNHDHGNNMVDIFKVITDAVAARQGSSTSKQLSYAGKTLSKRVPSATAQMYASGLKQAAKDFSSKDLTAQNAMQFIQTLLGGKLAVPAEQPPSQAGALENILSALAGGERGRDTTFDLRDVLRIGADYLQSKESDQFDLEALAGAILSNTQIGQKKHRAVSGKFVTKALLEVFSGMQK